MLHPQRRSSRVESKALQNLKFCAREQERFAERQERSDTLTQAVTLRTEAGNRAGAGEQTRPEGSKGNSLWFGKSAIASGEDSRFSFIQKF